MKKIFALFLIFLLVLSGCKNSNSPSGSGNAGSLDTEDSSISGEANLIQSDSEMFTDRDYEVDYNENESALIQLNGDSASCNSDAVTISGTTVTIKDEGTYIISGTLNDGMIIVNAGENDKPQIVFNNASIHSKTSAPLYILEADKVFLTLATDSVNTLSNGGTFTAIDENNIDAAIFSKQDLTLNGAGSLTITSPGGHGIVSKDDLVFTSGTYAVTSASHGLDANDSVRITNATVTVDAGKDGIHAENNDDTSLGFVYISSGTVTIASKDDGVHASESLTISGGTINITESYEGLEALDIAISGGDISLVSTDDGLNAAGGMDSSGFGGPHGDDIFAGGIGKGPNDKGGNRGGMGGGPGGMGGNPMSGSSNGSITISGGNLYINASGDGIDANGSLTISGGFTTVCGPTQGDTATLDYDTGAIITGGTFIGTGAAGMAQTFSDSEQGVIAVSVGNQSAGTTITLTDANGNTIISYAPELSFGVVILSSPDIISGENYTITVGSISGEFKAD